MDQLAQNLNKSHDNIGNTLKVVIVCVERLLIISNSWKLIKIIGQRQFSRKLFEYYMIIL